MKKAQQISSRVPSRSRSRPATTRPIPSIDRSSVAGGTAIAVQTIVLYQGSEKRWTVPRNWVGIGRRVSRDRFDRKKSRTPETGSAHQVGLVA